MTRVLFLFVDGVGIGPDDPTANPLAAADLPGLLTLTGGQRPVLEALAEASLPFAPLDATLGVPGLPQSATGQAALLTGVNAAALLGRHLGPYPGAQLRPLLAEASLWRRLLDAGCTVTLANAYPDQFIERAGRGTGRLGAMARSAALAGVALRGPEDLRQGRAVSAFLTNAGWREHLGYQDMPLVSRGEAGARLARLARDHDFTLFEYYATDMAGHRGDLAAGRQVLEAYDAFLQGLLADWSQDDVIVLASDHGNLEDATSSKHTLNPALGAWYGPPPDRKLVSLTDIAPAILAALTTDQS